MTRSLRRKAADLADQLGPPAEVVKAYVNQDRVEYRIRCEEHPWLRPPGTNGAADPGVRWQAAGDRPYLTEVWADHIRTRHETAVAR